ncbi:MAG: hypothetical protein ACYC6L_06615 [Anaerolineae bacterium]
MLRASTCRNLNGILRYLPLASDTFSKPLIQLQCVHGSLNPEADGRFYSIAGCPGTGIMLIKPLPAA